MSRVVGMCSRRLYRYSWREIGALFFHLNRSLLWCDPRVGALLVGDFSGNRGYSIIRFAHRPSVLCSLDQLFEEKILFPAPEENFAVAFAPSREFPAPSSRRTDQRIKRISALLIGNSFISSTVLRIKVSASPQTRVRICPPAANTGVNSVPECPQTLVGGLVQVPEPGDWRTLPPGIKQGCGSHHT